MEKLNSNDLYYTMLPYHTVWCTENDNSDSAEYMHIKTVFVAIIYQ